MRASERTNGFGNLAQRALTGFARWVALAAATIALLGVDAVRAENPLLQALDSNAHSAASESEAAAPAGDPLLAIENALAGARQRLSALDRARAAEDRPAPASSSEELAARRVRVLEQRREAQIRTSALELGRAAIEAGLARDPSEILADPPPFPVPTLDGVLQAWQHAAEQEARHRSVLEDRRANLGLAKEHMEALDKDRRRLRDVLNREGDALERIRLEAELRELEDRLEIAREQAALTAQRVVNATIEHDIKRSSTRQARAALIWVETQLAPRDADLTDAIERLDRERLLLNRQLDLARSRLVSAEGTLRASEERSTRVEEKDRADYEFERSARRAQLSHRQHIVALLNERIERLGRMRTAWQHR